MKVWWMRRWALLLGTCSLAVLFTACSFNAAAPTPIPPTAPPSVTLTASGSGSVTSILANLKASFEADNPGYVLNTISGTGTGGGVQGVLDGILDVAAMARAPRDSESDAGLQYLRFGDTAVTIMVHPDVGVTNLSSDQVRAIFLGEVTNWSQVGGQDSVISIYVRDEEESSTIALRQTLFGDTPFPETVAGVLASAGDMISTIAKTPGAVGFGNWVVTVASDQVIKTLTLDGISPDEDAYPVVTALGIGYIDSRSEAIQPLLDWLLSERGQVALVELGLINLPDSAG
ncbi:MAG: substrate-binding domain-containing protein [Anaerolineae bacterium]|nr:substrate-binding domain-containing protein [Anaerolineae bacterium]